MLTQLREYAREIGKQRETQQRLVQENGFVVKVQYVRERNKFIAKFGNLKSERAAFAKSQIINKEILSNSSNF